MIYVLIAVGFLMVLLIIFSDSKPTDAEDMIRNMDSSSPVGFERFVASLFEHNGYRNARVTKASGDFGADVIMRDKNGQKICIQCKKYKSHVGVAAVQQIVAAKSYYGCDIAAVATDNYFTASAIELANSNGVRLYDRDDLIEMIRSASKPKDAGRDKTKSKDRRNVSIQDDEREEEIKKYESMPEIPYIEGSKEYIAMLVQEDDATRRIMSLMSEFFDKQEDAKHFCLAATKHYKFPFKIVQFRDTGKYSVVAENIPYYKLTICNMQELDGLRFFMFANWG